MSEHERLVNFYVPSFTLSIYRASDKALFVHSYLLLPFSILFPSFTAYFTYLLFCISHSYHLSTLFVAVHFPSSIPSFPPFSLYVLWMNFLLQHCLASFLLGTASETWSLCMPYYLRSHWNRNGHDDLNYLLTLISPGNCFNLPL